MLDFQTCTKVKHGYLLFAAKLFEQTCIWLYIVSYPDPTFSQGKQSGEPSQISWASITLLQNSAHNPLKKVMDTRVEIFYCCKGSAT